MSDVNATRLTLTNQVRQMQINTLILHMSDHWEQEFASGGQYIPRIRLNLAIENFGLALKCFRMTDDWMPRDKERIRRHAMSELYCSGYPYYMRFMRASIHNCFA